MPFVVTVNTVLEPTVEPDVSHSAYASSSPERGDNKGMGIFLPWIFQVTLSQLSVIPISIDNTVWMSKYRKF